MYGIIGALTPLLASILPITRREEERAKAEAERLDEVAKQHAAYIGSRT